MRDKWKIYCPSYKRPAVAFSHKIFDPKKFCYVVRQEEAQEYRKALPQCEIMEIPMGSVKNLLETRHWIFENKTTEYVLQVDDDMSSVCYMPPGRAREKIKLDPESINHLCDKGFSMAEEIGTGYWGINCQSDPRFYQQIRPFSLSNIINGPFMGVLDTTIRSDPRMPLKEDYDFFLQILKKYRKVIRFNMYHYTVDHQKMAGGCQTYRTREAEREQNEILRQKWGSEIVKFNFKSKDSINMIIRKPI